MYSHEIICASSAVNVESSPTQEFAPLGGREAGGGEERSSTAASILPMLIFGFVCGLLNCLHMILVL
jgi:hypothetical protein